MTAAKLPVIPETITVHLGAPDAPAENVRVPFVEYVKNVASSEIYPSWPEAAIRANMLAQISFALNRVYTEFYRSRGYPFDITSSTAHDQSYVQGRDIFGNLSRIAEDLFNDYVVRRGTVQPYFTQYCNGTTSTCDGLSQWGTVALAQQGLVPYEILQRYYGQDIDIVFNAPVGSVEASYPGVPLRLGSLNEAVRVIKRQLNRIGENYPAIPRIDDLNGYYTTETEAAVRQFQNIFNLEPDGIVGKATWYKIRSIYNGVKRLNELRAEGLTLEEVTELYPRVLREGDVGDLVQDMQFTLAVIAYFDPQIPLPGINGVFDRETKEALQAFQRQYGLTPDGILGRETGKKLTQVYRGILQNLPEEIPGDSMYLYPGRYLLPGMQGDDVRDLQTLLQEAAARNEGLLPVTVNGVYDEETERAVRALQAQSGTEVNGIVGPTTWNRILTLAGKRREPIPDF